MARSRDRKNKRAATRAPLVLGGLIIAGGIGASVWLNLRDEKKREVTNPVPATPVTNNVANEGDPGREESTTFLAWLSNRTDASELLNAGTTLLEQGRTAQAILCYRRAVELKPEEEEAHFNLGVAYGRLGQLSYAERHYREALRILPDYAEAHNNLGNVLTRKNPQRLAIMTFCVRQ